MEVVDLTSDKSDSSSIEIISPEKSNGEIGKILITKYDNNANVS